MHTRVIRQNKHVFSRKINRKIKKPVFKPVRAFVLQLPYNYTIFLIRAFYGAKNRLKRNVLIFYAIMSTQKSPVLPIFCLLSRARTYIRIKTQTKHTMVITTHLQKRFFQKFFLSQNFKFLNFGFSRNFLSSEMGYMYQAIAAGFNPAGVLYVLSVFECSYTFACIH